MKGTLFMNDNELEEILNEIKNNKSHKKELDSEGFEDILNSLHSDDVQEPEKVVEKPVKKAEKNSEKPKEVKTETPSKQTKEEFHIVSENPQQEYDEDDFKPANEIADLIDYIGCGPVYATNTKKTAVPVGLEYVKYATEHAKMPFVAIGGIKEHNIHEVYNAGATTIAVVSDITSADDIVDKISKLAKK